MPFYQKKIHSKIASLYPNQQIPAWGVYEGLPPCTSTNDFDGNKGWWSPRRLQRKSWVFLGAYSADVFVGIAIVDAGYIGQAFCYVYFPEEEKLFEKGYQRPFAFAKDFDADLTSDWQLGPFKIYTSADGQLHGQYRSDDFVLEIACQQNEKGLSFVCPSEGKKRPFHFTYKNLLLPTQVTCTIDGQKQHFEGLKSGIDFSKGYPPRQTSWNWVSFLGKTADGQAVGINLVDGFNQNIENAVWIGEERHLLGKVSFDYSRPLTQSTWQVHSEQNNLELYMQPNGSRAENLNLKVLKSDFTQVFGKITGRIRLGEKWQSLEGYGVMEEHEAVW